MNHPELFLEIPELVHGNLSNWIQLRKAVACLDVHVVVVVVVVVAAIVFVVVTAASLM